VPAVPLPEEFVAESPLMVELVDTVRRIAEQDVTVLVSGETGVGKGRVAELLHRFSPRRTGTFLQVHCPSLSEGLIEDELFGHEIGAFTGAHSRRVGPFVYAAGGTLVLDEVGGLAPDGQVALLRLLETREVRPLGSARAVPLDVRIVATTSRDLAQDVERGLFRRDLYFRLNVAQIPVPPLRLRRLDLPRLVSAAIRRHNASAERPVTGVDPRVLDLLFEHPWRGNLRELENALSRSLLQVEGGELLPGHLELESFGAPPSGDGLERVDLNPRQAALLEILSEGQRITSVEHAERCGITPRTALRDLVELAERGFLVREGARRGMRFRRVAEAVSGQ
jgi:DNA-binding NtrC family response regulator